VSAHASDQIYRYSVNSTALLSPIEQYITSKFKTLTGYWPMQDESTSLTAASNIFGSQPATASGMRFQGDTTLPGADGAASMGNSGAYMRGATVTTSPKGAVSMLFWFKLTTIPTVQTSIISFTMVGTPVKWYRVSVDNVNFYVDVYGQDGTLLFGYSALKGANTVLSDWICMRFQVSDTGSGGYRSGITWRSIYSDTSYIVTDALAGSPGTVGTCVAFTFGPGANAPDVALSNVAIMQELFDFEDPNLHLASKAFSGELAGARFLRLCSLAGIAGYLEGWNFETMALGPQPRGAVLDLMRDLEKADGGILSGTRWRLGLTYITRACISGRYSTMTLSHAASHLSFAPKPVEDSYGVTNDFTANRSGGSSARSVVSTGSLGTGSIGTVAGADTYNALDDTQLPSLAGWQTALGTWDEPRFPDVQIALERPETPLNSTLGRSIISMDIGRNFVLSNLPTHQPPGPYELLAQGYSEALGNRTMRTDWSTTPYGPWRAFRMGDPFITPRFQVADTVILSAGASDTLLTFVTPGSTKKILTSGTFEEPGAAALAAWFAVSCTIVQSNTVANSGTYSMQLTVVGSPSFAYARQLDAYKPPVTVGTRYRCYLLARSPLASPDVAAVIDWYDASYVYISSSSTTVALVANTWTYIQVDAVAPAGAAYAAYGPTIGSSPAAGKVVYVDDVYFRDLSVAGSTRWITSPEMPSAFPMNVMIGGEKMTVTALTNLGEVQTATVTRAVNGISKAQTDGTPVQLNPITTFSR
jgi:hypothetical protein